MSWRAFTVARIHIDHIVPLSSFDVDNPGELKAAWALSNLRPMWAKDNVEKADRRETLLRILDPWPPLALIGSSSTAK
jgi:hypothetical protein